MSRPSGGQGVRFSRKTCPASVKTSHRFDQTKRSSDTTRRSSDATRCSSDTTGRSSGTTKSPSDATNPSLGTSAGCHVLARPWEGKAGGSCGVVGVFVQLDRTDGRGRPCRGDGWAPRHSLPFGTSCGTRHPRRPPEGFIDRRSMRRHHPAGCSRVRVPGSFEVDVVRGSIPRGPVAKRSVAQKLSPYTCGTLRFATVTLIATANLWECHVRSHQSRGVAPICHISRDRHPGAVGGGTGAFD